MIVIIGTNIPNRVRGVLKIWMIEVKPGTLIGNVNTTIENRIVKFIEPYLNNKTDLVLIRSNSSVQGFEVRYDYNSSEKVQRCQGLQLFKKKLDTRPTT